MKRGEMNVVTDYNTIGYFISGDTVQGFQYELINALRGRVGNTHKHISRE